MENFSCSNCSFNTIVDAFLITHIAKFHKNDPNLKINCVSNGCSATFVKWTVFEKHVRTIHPEMILMLNATNVDAFGNVINIIDFENEGNT